MLVVAIVGDAGGATFVVLQQGVGLLLVLMLLVLMLSRLAVVLPETSIISCGVVLMHGKGVVRKSRVLKQLSTLTFIAASRRRGRKDN